MSTPAAPTDGAVSRRGAVVSAALSFASFALPASMLGVVWPQVAQEFDRSLGSLGVVSLTYGLARMSTAVTGRGLARRLGLGWAFPLVLGVLALSCGALALAPTWTLFLLAAVGVGIASGALDSLGATFISTREEVGSAGLVQGAYGVGATVGPMTVAVLPGWRVAVAACLVVALAAIAVAIRVRRAWPDVAADEDTSPPTTVPRTAVVLSLVAFAAFVAAEVTMGQWSFTWLVDHRGMAATTAATAVSAYWGGMTVSRLALARPWLADVVERRGLAPFIAAGGVVLAALVVLPVGLAVATTGLLGLCLGPTIPSLFATTARRVGRRLAARMAGWQLLATNVGAIAVPSATGWLVDRRGPGVVVPVVAAALVGVGLPALVALRRMPPVGEVGATAGTRPRVDGTPP